MHLYLSLNMQSCYNGALLYDLPRQQWSLLNRFRTDQVHCGACRRKWRLTDTDLCPCGETQTMSHIVESCPLTKLNGGLSQLHCADEDAVSWLTSYGSWNAYEKKKITVQHSAVIGDSSCCYCSVSTISYLLIIKYAVDFEAMVCSTHYTVYKPQFRA